MPSVLSIGSSLVDIFVQSDEFQLEKSSEGLLLCQRYGEKIEISDFSLHTGGGASNTAVGFVRLGMDASIIAELGRDSWSEIIAADLKKSNVRTDYMVVEKKEHTGGSVILIGKDGGRTVLVHRGAASQLDPQDVPPSAIEQADWVHLSSISGRKETLIHIFSLLQRGERKLSWNPGKQELKLIAQAELDVSQIPCSVLLLNKQEWESVQTVAHILKKHIPEIVITDGSEGGWIIGGDVQTPFVVEKVRSVDDTGAGDAFAVGYVAARVLGESVTTALHWAKANAQSVVQFVGAKPGLLTKSGLEEMLKHVS